MSAALEQARKVSAWASSYERLDVVMNALGSLSRLDQFALLGSEWSVCDNLWRWRSLLREWLRDASREQLDSMMEPAERDALAQLPSRITVYRGCYKINRSGLSWTLDRAVAEKFPSLMRYWRPGDQPLLLTGTVSRDRVVLKLERKEQEIIAARVKIINAEPLLMSESQALDVATA